MAFMRVVCFVLLVGLAAAACQPDCAKCPPMWTFYNDNCYRYFGTGKPFAEAERHCQQFTQVGQAHLASIASRDENNLLFTMWESVRGTTEGGLWIGYNDLVNEGYFSWTDLTEITYTGWSDNEPGGYGSNRDCVEMMRDNGGQWEDKACGGEKSFFCKLAVTK
ncbi:alpha-N-acetylgalactosamine-specific lectin-like [Patiria miniata]|uniref:C-type lectin domain-containing protein n=1 Tax=Patiria miniata TaxID=46514 RepID=A0A914AR07_PATMI|nr:alpha-N-acetylgalactosamine-specific lectin-like [Patiria miniata]